MSNLYRTFYDSLYGLWMSFVERAPYLVVGLMTFLAVILIGKLVTAAIRRIGERAGLHRNLRQLFGRLVSFAAWIIGILVAATIVLPTFRPGDLIAGLGITTVAVGFAFKDILQNFFAGILILLRQPFKVGDEIVSGKFEGFVEDINSRSTRIRTYDGERAVIPNGEVYTNAVLVRTAYDKRRLKFVVGIGYKDSIDEARRTILAALSSTEGVEQDPGPWALVTELAPSSVNLTVYFWIDSKRANALKVTDRVAEAIKNALDDAGIDMPYPHRVVLLDNTAKAGSSVVNVL